VTIEELLDGKQLGLPRLAQVADATFKKSPKARKKGAENEEMEV
jgi:hypothetical protein